MFPVVTGKVFKEQQDIVTDSTNILCNLTTFGAGKLHPPYTLSVFLNVLQGPIALPLSAEDSKK